MFGNPSEPSCVYRYGAYAPTTNIEIVHEQMRIGSRYRNKLCEIELARRAERDAFLREASGEVNAAEKALADICAEIDKIKTEIAEYRKRARKRKLPPELSARRKELFAARKAARQRRNAAKKAAYKSSEFKEGLHKIDVAAIEKIKQARAESGLYWGTYSHVEQSMKGTQKGPPPKFKSYRNGEGTIAVQVQHGLTVREAESCKDTRIRIEGTGRKRILHIRVGSNGRKPIWATVPFVYHRPLPEDALIKWVRVTSRRVACHFHWYVLFTVSRPSGWKKADLAPDGVVAMDIGWRLFRDRFRVAYWVGSDGQEGEICLPLEYLDRRDKKNDLRKIRDEKFNAIRDKLADWIEAKTDALPQWLKEDTTSLRQWKSQARLAGLVLRWSRQRFTGDEEIFPELEDWRSDDRHLYEWEVNQERKAIAWRNEQYRIIAAELSRRYRKAVIEDINLHELSDSEKATDSANNATRDGKVGDGKQAWRRMVASVGRLKQFIKERFDSTVEVKCEWTTQDCAYCGERMNVDAAHNVVIKCPSCGVEIDQDRNAALNLLKRAGVPLESILVCS